jgi:DNA-binding MarR family transcriptional regulator
MTSKVGITNIFYDLRQVRVVNNFKLKPTHKLVLYVLESRGNRIIPSKSSIAEDCGYSKATINKAIKDLQKADLVRVKRRFNSSNRYFLNKEAIHKVAEELHEEASLKKSIQSEFDDPDYDPWEA